MENYVQLADAWLSLSKAQFFQRCLGQNQIPAMWKLGIITPIHQGESRTESSNQRPVFIIIILSKVMESIVADTLVCNLENCSSIKPEQHASSTAIMHNEITNRMQ
ncbi:unnamed protein product [Dicrocoelium dendriticum]|nr:unnamed protein product [Dicrocoelium dendriticum]